MIIISGYFPNKTTRKVLVHMFVAIVKAVVEIGTVHKARFYESYRDFERLNPFIRGELDCVKR